MELTKEIIDDWCKDNGYMLSRIVHCDNGNIIPLTKQEVINEGIDGILRRVSSSTGISQHGIMKRTRKRHLLEVRQLCHYIGRIKLGETLATVSWGIGRLNHATILNSCKTIQQLLDTDKIFCRKYEDIIKLYSLKTQE